MSLPRYREIARELKEQIQVGHYKEHQTIPSEPELAKLYDVSRMTARQAINELVYEGVLYRVKGKGTFVNHQKYEKSIHGLTSFSEDMIQKGFKPSSRLISQTVRLANEIVASKLQIKGLLLAGILIASLGAVMDVAMSISSSMFELASVSSKLTTRELIRSGMNVGTDMIGTMTNTLILALAGGSLSTVILIYSATISELQLVNLDVLGTELIQGIAGSIGIVITVPITVLIGAYMCIKKK